ncbi:multidrug transporter [Aquitalea sp. FJL05]|uniref:efflux transporter outer membrane subunit n=1 Tax=Aquitalea sp. FJL05 TaxID=2153366 RepID=UPI000F58F817|nr:efflux transporter outer membrane subunit [Aquitalea sp. FJL05]RQO77633.1 multidrug transporter [Aquitalea sp. FJL05]
MRRGHTLLQLSLLASLLLTGCASVPELGPAARNKTTTELASQQSLPATPAQWANSNWWLDYNDSQLNAIMQEALSNAPDLAAAQARLAKAAGQAEQAGASRLPSVSLDSSVTKLKQSYNNGMPAAYVPHGYNNSASVELNFSYEFDFWGKNRAAVAAASTELAAAVAEAAQSRLTLTSSIAAGYAELARLFAEQDAAEQALAVRRHSVELLQQRYDNGLETLGSLRQAESRAAGASADLSAARQAIAQQRFSLAALMGAGPDRGLVIARPQASLLHAQGLPATLQADLLGRRPDLAAARLRAEAAARRIDVAHAAFYPNVNLSAYLGVQSLGLSLLGKSGSDVGGIGPAISLPIFRGGALQGNYRVARAEYDAAVASYNQTLTQALHDVADVMAQEKELGPQLEQRRLALKTAEQSYQVMQNRYQGGLASYLDVLNAEDNVIATRRSAASLETRLLLLDVSLIKALGGGYQQA